MKIIFREEKGFVPDAPTLAEFLHKNEIEPDGVYPEIRIDKDDWIARFYKATNGKFYQESNSCGYEIYLYEFDSQKEFEAELATHLLVYCEMSFLKS